MHAGESYRDLLKRMVKSAFSGKPARQDLGMSFKFRHLRIETSPRARAFADSISAGRTPATITADLGAVRLIVPPAAARMRRETGSPKAN